MPIYQGHCRNLTVEQTAQYEAEGRKPVVRFRTPENQQVMFKDLVRANVFRIKWNR